MFGRQPFSVAPFCVLAFDLAHAIQRLSARDFSQPLFSVCDHSGPLFRVRDMTLGVP